MTHHELGNHQVVAQFPTGTPVRITQEVRHRGGAYVAHIVGLVESWESRPTGSWHAHGKNDRYWLMRLRLRKADGEIALLVIDDGTRIAKLEPAGSGS